MSEGINLSHRLLRIRARPKILLAQNYEEAWELYERYAGKILGIITDVSFPRGASSTTRPGIGPREKDPGARRRSPDPRPVHGEEHQEKAIAIGAEFMSKKSPHLLEDLRSTSSTTSVSAISSSSSPTARRSPARRRHGIMLRSLAEVPDESLVFHAEPQPLLGLAQGAHRVRARLDARPRKVTEFDSPSDLRSYLITTITGYLREIQQHVITDFDGELFNDFTAFSKIGTGSLGGKGRGLAFMHKILAREVLDTESVEIAIPQTVVLASDVFEEFLEDNRLRGFVTRRAT